MKYAPILFVLLAVLLLAGCSLRGAVTGQGAPSAVPGNNDLATTVNRLAFIAGIAAIGAVAAGIALKQYATALVGGPALAGLALVFLLLPAIAAAVKWLLISAVVMCIGGAAWLAYSRWKAQIAITLTAKHADRMENVVNDIMYKRADPIEEETVAKDIIMAKNMAQAEQVQSGVDKIIEKARGR